MSVGDICNREVVVADSGTSIAEAAELMRAYHVGDIVVVENSHQGKRPLGLITDRDIVIQVLAAGLSPEHVSVLDVMIRDLQIVPEETDLWDALDQMRIAGVRRMPVVDDNGDLIGILTLDDILELIGEALTDLSQLVEKEMRYEREKH